MSVFIGMPLSRLENFLKNVTGNVIYVNPEELDATDDISNKGSSRARPFKTIQRALIEAARFSYQVGGSNDKFDKTTILISPGTHFIDNRPGLQIDASGSLTDVNGTAATIDQFSIGTNFDIQDRNNVLHKFNSATGGVIIPRGTSLVGQDLRKTKIKPKFVPQPDNDSIANTAIFKVTGGCFFYGFSFFDAEPSDRIFKDYTSNVYAPNYSHHKVTCFEYADGVNVISGKGNTDLDMYYSKLTLAYGVNSGRALPVYPSNTDFEKSIDETRIVGAISQVGSVSISDIYSGGNPTDAVATPIVTVITETNHSFDVGTPILIQGIDDSNYDGSYIVSQVLSDTSFTYAVPSTPSSTATPNLSGKTAIVKIESDTVSSASPYIFNCSIRSVFGICGLNADGSKATGFKSMVVAQFTGIALNKDDNAYVKYNTSTGVWQDQAALGSGVSLHTDSLARHKPSYQNYHIRVSNNGVIQAVSVFAIGYAQHFFTTTGGDMSITNSNSNFGAKSLEADKFRFEAFLKDDKGYITEIIPPQNNFAKESTVTFLPLDVEATVGASTDTKLYINGFKQKDNKPNTILNGFNLGAKIGDILQVGIGNTVYGADILMPVPQTDPDERVSAKKEILVGRVSGINSITGNTFTLQSDHKFVNGETVRVYSENGSLPDGLDYNRVYNVITTSLNADQIQLASTLNNAVAGNEITGINNSGGILRVVSRVADKEAGDVGHPVQYDNSGWFINVGVGNSLSAAITANQSSVTPKTRSSFIKRTLDRREDLEKNYSLKYIIPQSSSLASAPISGFSIEDTSTVPDDTNYQNDNNVLSDETNLRSKTNIINASWGGNVGIITAEYPHGLKVGHTVQIYRLRSTNNTSGTDNSGFNGIFVVSSVTNATTFGVGLNTNPGGISTITEGIPYTFHDRTIVGSGRTFSPYFVRRDYNQSFQIHETQEVLEYKQGVQDGEYNLTLRGYISQPEVSPFSTTTNYFGQDIIDIVPSQDLDNRDYDPKEAVSYAVRDEIGKVETNDPERSITKEGINAFLREVGVVKNIDSTATSSGELTINTSVDHGFNGVVGIQSITGGAQYGTNSGNAEFYYNVRLEGGTGEGATADVTVSAASTISSITLSNPGSGYSIDDTLTVRGVPFHTPGTDCTLGISKILNNVGDAVQIVGVSSESYDGLYRIKSVVDKNTFTVNGSADASGTGGHVYHVGISTGITNITHDAISGIATVQLSGDIGLRRGDQIVIDGATDFASIYNGTFFISDRVGYGTSLAVNIGITSNAPAFTGVATAHGTGISVRGHGRNIPLYGGYTTKLNNDITSTSTGVTFADKGDLRRGDFLIIEDEIVMISNSAITTVIRGVLGTNAVAHTKEVSVRRIKPLPIENRRYSVLRASGHTFEYVGFGPGNYSTAMPQVQDRVRSEEEELIAQSLQTRGGFVVYTGMNDQGDFYIGNVKIDSATNKLKFVGGVGGRGGGEVGDTVLPADATFDNLVADTSFQSNGDTEVIDLLLKGNRSGDIGNSVFVGIHAGDIAPTSNVDNILLRTNFDKGGYLGWVKTGGSWARFGPISKSETTQSYAFDTLEVAGVSTFSSSINVTGTASVTGDVTASGTVTAEQLTTTDDASVGDALTVGGTATADTFVGKGVIPVGGIIMWSGTDGSIPSNWQLCDGTNGTPNLIDRFIVGRGSAYAADATGGSADAVIVTHDHTATSSVTDSGHDHHLFKSGNYGANQNQGASNLTTTNFPASGTGPSGKYEGYNIWGQGSEPDVGLSSSESTGITVGTTMTEEGVSGTNKNLPPYYAIAYIMRMS